MMELQLFYIIIINKYGSSGFCVLNALKKIENKLEAIENEKPKKAFEQNVELRKSQKQT